MRTHRERILSWASQECEKAKNGSLPSHWCCCHGVAAGWHDRRGCSESEFAVFFWFPSTRKPVGSLGNVWNVTAAWKVTGAFTSAPDAFSEQGLVHFRGIQHRKANRNCSFCFYGGQTGPVWTDPADLWLVVWFSLFNPPDLLTRQPLFRRKMFELINAGNEMTDWA